MGCASTTICTRCASWSISKNRHLEFRGLNLTLAVREGIVKHSRDYSAQEHPELAEYFLDQRPPLEAQLIDLADEIAYLTADLDDGMEAGILTLQQIRCGVPSVRAPFCAHCRDAPRRAGQAAVPGDTQADAECSGRRSGDGDRTARHGSVAFRMWRGFARRQNG